MINVHLNIDVMKGLHFPEVNQMAAVGSSPARVEHFLTFKPDDHYHYVYTQMHSTGMTRHYMYLASEVEQWMHENIRSGWHLDKDVKHIGQNRPYRNWIAEFETLRVVFEDEVDAALFKLRWC